jgi:hypothetical protein
MAVEQRRPSATYFREAQQLLDDPERVLAARSGSRPTPVMFF